MGGDGAKGPFSTCSINLTGIFYRHPPLLLMLTIKWVFTYNLNLYVCIKSKQLYQGTCSILLWQQSKKCIEGEIFPFRLKYNKANQMECICIQRRWGESDKFCIQIKYVL